MYIPHKDLGLFFYYVFTPPKKENCKRGSNKLSHITVQVEKSVSFHRFAQSCFCIRGMCVGILAAESPHKLLTKIYKRACSEIAPKCSEHHSNCWLVVIVVCEQTEAEICYTGCSLALKELTSVQWVNSKELAFTWLSCCCYGRKARQKRKKSLSLTFNPTSNSLPLLLFIFQIAFTFCFPFSSLKHHCRFLHLSLSPSIRLSLCFCNIKTLVSHKPAAQGQNLPGRQFYIKKKKKRN